MAFCPMALLLRANAAHAAGVRGPLGLGRETWHGPLNRDADGIRFAKVELGEGDGAYLNSESLREHAFDIRFRSPLVYRDSFSLRPALTPHRKWLTIGIGSAYRGQTHKVFQS